MDDNERGNHLVNVRSKEWLETIFSGSTNPANAKPDELVDQITHIRVTGDPTLLASLFHGVPSACECQAGRAELCGYSDQ